MNMPKRSLLSSLILILCIALGFSSAKADEWIHTVVASDAFSQNPLSITLNGVTWEVDTIHGKGSPGVSVNTKTGLSGSFLRFGMGNASYSKTITLSTDYFSSKKVSRVDVNCVVYGESEVTMTASQGSITIGSQTNRLPSDEVKTISVLGNEGVGGSLLIRFDVTIGLYIQSLAVTYTDGGGEHTAMLTGISLSGDYPLEFSKGDAFSHEGMTVTAHYDDESLKEVTSNATFSGYEMNTAGTQTVTVSYTEAEVTKTADYSIVVNDLPDYIIAYYVDGEQVKVEQLKTGEALNFPEVSVPGGSAKKFMGWVTTPSVQAETKPTFVRTSTTTATTDATYYAVFATEKDQAAYVLVDEQLEDWSGKYLIVSENYASNGTLVGKDIDDVSIGPSYRDGNTIKTSFGDNKCITIVSCDNGYVLQLQDESYFYRTKSGNTSITNENYSTAANHPLTITYADSEVSIACHSYFLRYTGDSFTFVSKTSDNEPITLYRRQDKVYDNYTTMLTARFNIAAACTDGKKYYTTFSTDKAFVVPEDVTVEEVAVINDLIHKVAYTPGSVVPARTGVLISSVISGEHAALYSDEPGTSVLAAENLLRPSGDAGITASAMAEKDADCIYYRLTMHNGTQAGFWWGAEDGAAFDLAKNKAYLAVPKAIVSAVRGFDFVNAVDATEGVSAQAVTTEAKVYYDLSGRCLRESKQRGLYIVDGKKVIR